MPTPSGRISFDDIRVEFNGSIPILLSNYYLAPTGVVPIYLPNQGLPTSGPLSLADLRSRSRLRAVLPAGGFSFSGVGSTQRYIGFSLDPTDNLWRLRWGAGRPPSAVTSSGIWKFSGAASECEIMCTATKDFDPASMARNVWYNLGGGAFFYFDGQSIQPSVTGTVNIRYASTQLLLTTCGFSFSWEPGSVTVNMTAGSETIGFQTWVGFSDDFGSVSPSAVNGVNISGLFSLVIDGGLPSNIFELTFQNPLTISSVSFTDRFGVFRNYLASNALFNNGQIYRWDAGGIQHFNVGAIYPITITL